MGENPGHKTRKIEITSTEALAQLTEHQERIRAHFRNFWAKLPEEIQQAQDIATSIAFHLLATESPLVQAMDEVIPSYLNPDHDDKNGYFSSSIPTTNDTLSGVLSNVQGPGNIGYATGGIIRHVQGGKLVYVGSELWHGSDQTAQMSICMLAKGEKASTVEKGVKDYKHHIKGAMFEIIQLFRELELAGYIGNRDLATPTGRTELIDMVRTNAMARQVKPKYDS